MRKLPYLIAAAAISGLAFTANPGMASPLAGGLSSGSAANPELNEGLVQKVHGRHCKRRYGWFRGDKRWHRHRRACHYGYRYYHPYAYGAPFIGFSFGIGPHRHRHRHHHHWWD